jgi:hypothetical protein
MAYVRKESTYQTRNEAIVGIQFSDLKAVRRVGCDNGSRALWEFNCSCGALVVKVLDQVKRGKTTSCGCHRSKGPREWGNRRIAAGEFNSDVADYSEGFGGSGFNRIDY